jgi:hypothetical protein
MHRLDQPLESSRPSGADRLRSKAARSHRASIVFGLLALALMVLTTFVLLGCFLARVNPFSHHALVLYLALAVPAIPLLATACGIFSLRHATLRAMIKEKGPVREY